MDKAFFFFYIISHLTSDSQANRIHLLVTAIKSQAFTGKTQF